MFLLSSLSCSSKLIDPGRGYWKLQSVTGAQVIIWLCNWPLNLRGVGGAGVGEQSCRTEPLTWEIRYFVQVDSVRMWLNCRTPSWDLRTILDVDPPPLWNDWIKLSTRTALSQRSSQQNWLLWQGQLVLELVYSFHCTHWPPLPVDFKASCLIILHELEQKGEAIKNQCLETCLSLLKDWEAVSSSQQSSMVGCHPILIRVPRGDKFMLHHWHFQVNSLPQDVFTR